MEFLKKLKRIRTVLIVFVIVISSIGLFLYLDSQRIGAYVQENYLVADSGKSTVGKQAFVYEYTVTTGDTTLADILGVSTQVNINTGSGNKQVYLYDTSKDWRGLAKAVASAWILQGVHATEKLEVDDMASTAYQEQQTYDGSAESLITLLVDKYGFTGSEVYNLYDAMSGDKTYSVTTALGTSSIRTCRCCCCLTEGMIQYLAGTEYATSISHRNPRWLHVVEVGMCSEDLEYYQHEPNKLLKTPNWQNINGKNRVVGSGLAGVSGSSTVNDLIQQDKLGVGSIIMWTSDEEVTDLKYDHPSHIAMVVYIDDTYVYTAGAGSSVDIVSDAILGYDKAHERAGNFYKEFDYTGGAVSNIVPWNKSSIVIGK